MSKRNQYANWCDLCCKPLPKHAEHEHCPKCKAAPDAIVMYEDAANRWGLDIYHYTCQVCKNAWIKDYHAF